MTIQTIKFSEMTAGGDLPNDSSTPGLLASANVLFNNPWTFLAPGTTGDRPIPAASMYNRLRFNTTLEIYEYYDPTIPIWVELSGSGTGTVNPGVVNDIAFYAASGQAVSPIASANNSVLVTSNVGLPSLSTTLPSGLSIPGATITASTAALLSGSVVAAPVAGIDMTNKTYVDALVGGTVLSITGTTNQVIASSPTGNVNLSLPQDIALGSTPTFAGMTLSSIPLGSASGGTGINNGTSTLTLAGNLATVGGFASIFTMTGATNVTFPTSGTLATTAGTVSSVSGTLNRITSTGGTTPVIDISAAYVGQASITTLGTITTGVWTGTTIAIANGGTGVTSVTTAPTATSFAGWDANSNLSANNFLGGFTTIASSGGTTTLTVASKSILEITGTLTQTVVMPVASTLVAGTTFKIINNSSGVVTVNSSGANLILSMAANTTAFITLVLASGTTAASWNASYVFDNGAGVLSITGTANQVIASASTGAITLSTPQDIGTSSAVQFSSARLSNTGILDANNNPIITFIAGTTPVNNLRVLNSATGVAVNLVATGTDSNVDMSLTTRGTGKINLVTAAPTNPLLINSGTSNQHNTSFVFSDTAASRTVTFPDATGTVQFVAGAGGLKSFQIFTSGTAATYTTPAGITSILIEVWGGGGGGGGVAATASSLSAAGGGSAGGYAKLWVASAAASYTYTVGGGGNGGVAGNNNGTAGGTTTFSASSLQATGGGGGLGSAGFLTTAAGFTQSVSGGVGSNGIVNANGAVGYPGISVLGSGVSGTGASSAIGGGGVGQRSNAGATSVVGANASLYASGGSGAITGAATDRAGGNGSGGFIIVWEFS